MTSDSNILNPVIVINVLKCTPCEKTPYECLWETFMKEKNIVMLVEEIWMFPPLHEGCSAYNVGMHQQHVGWKCFYYLYVTKRSCFFRVTCGLGNLT